VLVHAIIININIIDLVLYIHLSRMKSSCLCGSLHTCR